MALSEFPIKNRVPLNIFFIVVCALGVIAYFTLPVELNPEVSLETAVIVTYYPGVAPEDIESLITIPIEDEIEDLDGLNRVISLSSEGRSQIIVEYKSDIEDYDDAFRDLEEEVNKVKGLPKDAEDPILIKLDTTLFPVINVLLSSDEASEAALKELADNLEDLIEDIPGVGSVDVAGTREREIWVEVDPQKLYGYGLSILDVSESLKARNLNLPGGSVDVGHNEYLIRTIGEYKNLDQMRQTVISADGAGRFVQLGDIAEVSDTFEEEVTRARLNGKKAIALSVLKEKEGKSFDIVRDLKEVVEDHLSLLPYRVDVAYINDTTISIGDTLNRLKQNAALGILLVFITLYLMIGLRSAIFAAIGIPFTFLFTFAMFKQFGITINGVSLFSLVLVLGLIVDDAIIIIENIYRHMEEGLPPAQAAVLGIREVAYPVISAVTTTVAAFVPMLLMTGIIGKFLSVIPKVVTFALLASLVEALFILPSHIADFGRVGKRAPAAGLLKGMERVYMKLVFRVLRVRYLAILVTILLAAGSLALIPHIGIDLFRDDEISQFYVRVRAPNGYRMEDTDKIVKRIEEYAMELPKEEVTAVVSRTGIIIGEHMVETGSNVGEVMVDLVEKRDRERSLDELMEELRKKVETISGIDSVEFARVDTGPPVGKPVAVRIKGKNYEDAEPIKEEIKGILRGIEGVKDIKDDLKPGKNQVKIMVDDERAAMFGLTHSAAAEVIRTCLDGTVATTFRDGDEEVDVVVKLKRGERDDIADIGRMKIMTPAGEMVRLSTIADVRIERGYADIRRRDFERTVSVTAEIDQRITTSSKVNKILGANLPALKRKYPDFDFSLGGEYTKTQESFASLKESLLIALLLIYLILGSQFKSFLQPLVIMFTVPFAFIGVIFGLLVNGDPFSIVAFIAVVALAGIVVNDSLVLVDFINERRRRGRRKWRAIVEAGRTRMRPIILTSLTTIFGLLPMALGMGGKSVVWSPMATSIIWGLSFATLLTLFIIPALYSIITDWAEGKGSGSGGK